MGGAGGDAAERRISERTTARKLVCVTRDGSPSAMYELVDLSGGGIRVRAAGTVFERGERVEVELELDGVSVEARGRIAHVTDGEAGIELDELSAEARAALELAVVAADWAF